MIKPYVAQKRLPPNGTAMLIIGAIVLGLALGALAFFVSKFIYLIFIFPFAVGLVALVAYDKLLQFTKVSHPLVTTLMGLVIGLLIAVAFYGTPYQVLRNNFIADAQKKYQVNAQRASQGFDKILAQKTGSSGFVGFMKLRAQEGDKYTNYLVVSSIPIHEFSFTLKATWAWVYWGIETLIITLLAAWKGFNKNEFNQSANDWYSSMPKQIGSISLDNKEKLSAAFQTSDLKGISELIAPDDKLSHPMLEIYETHSKTRKGNILLTIKQTYRQNSSTVKRKSIGRWEIPAQEYAQVMEMLKQNLSNA